MMKYKIQSLIAAMGILILLSIYISYTEIVPIGEKELSCSSDNECTVTINSCCRTCSPDYTAVNIKTSGKIYQEKYKCNFAICKFNPVSCPVYSSVSFGKDVGKCVESKCTLKYEIKWDFVCPSILKNQTDFIDGVIRASKYYNGETLSENGVMQFCNNFINR